ncbi:MerR family transcriptional regulator [Mycetocola reblochoni]|uniref:MerR family transcriptional regulator n=1 Tax=Mycetocola reblochoni TaxID=331618 RepID=UPI003F9AA48F
MSGFSANMISIGELSDRTGVSVRALRYYEQHSLLFAERTRAGHRLFPPDAIEAVRRIRMFLDAGLPLAVVSQVMPCFVDDGARLHACVAEYLHDHLDTVRERIKELDEQRDTIERLRQLVVS